MPWILAGVAVLLTLNLTVLLLLYLRREPTAPPNVAASTAAVTVSPPATLVASVRPAQVRPLADEAPVESIELIEPPVPEARISSPLVSRYAETNIPPARRVSGADDLAAAVASQQQATLDAAPGGNQSHASLPSINDLGPQATAGLPSMNVDLHVYATDPTARFVVINGRRYIEGGRLPEGALVEHITPDGVIMNNKGTRFLLPRE